MAVAGCAADTIRSLVELTGSGPRAPVQVLGPLSLVGLTLRRPLHFKDVTFVGTVHAAHADFAGGLSFEDCVFQGGVDLEGARSGGSVTFRSCEFGLSDRRSEQDPEASLKLDHATIGGHLIIDQSRMQGDLTAFSLDLSGDLSVAASSLLNAKLNHATVAGNVDLDARPTPTTRSAFNQASEPAATDEVPRTRLRGYFSADCASIHGDLRLGAAEVAGYCQISSARIRGVAVEGADIQGSLTAIGLTVGETFNASGRIGGELSLYGGSMRNVVLSALTIGADVNAIGIDCTQIFRIEERCSIGRDLGLSLARIGGQLDLKDISSVGKIDLRSVQCGSFLAGTSSDCSVKCDSIDAVDASFSGQARFGNVVVKCEQNLLGQPSSDSGLEMRPDIGISFQNCRFESGLAFWSPYHSDKSVAQKRYVTAFQDKDLAQRSSISGGISIIDCQVIGDLDCTGVRIENHEAHDSPPGENQIALDRTRVTGALRFCSPESFANRRRIDKKARRNAVALSRSLREHPDQRDKWLATAEALSIAGIAANDVDLTGLKLVKDGHIDAARVSVAGTFKTYDELSGAGGERLPAHTDIPGSLHLEGAEISELLLSKRSFSNIDSDDPEQDGILLTDATIGRLRVPRLVDEHCKPEEGHRAFPVPLDLDGADIHSWSFDMSSGEPAAEGPPAAGLTPEEQQRVIADRYLDVLDNDFRLHRPIYRSVAAQLRNAGYEEAANRVYFAELYRSFWAARGAWKRGRGRLGRDWGIEKALRHLWEKFFRHLIKYGTSPGRLFWVFLGLFVFTWLLVALEPRNFEANESVREVLSADSVELNRGYALVGDGAVLGPDPAHWSWVDALWMTARFHVPVVGLSARSDFRPTNDRAIVWSVGLDPPSYEDPLPFYWSPSRGTLLEPGASVLPIDPDSWFNLMLVLNWIIWPLLLTFALRKVLRNE